MARSFRPDAWRWTANSPSRPHGAAVNAIAPNCKMWRSSSPHPARSQTGHALRRFRFGSATENWRGDLPGVTQPSWRVAQGGSGAAVDRRFIRQAEVPAALPRTERAGLDVDRRHPPAERGELAVRTPRDIERAVRVDDPLDLAVHAAQCDTRSVGTRRP